MFRSLSRPFVALLSLWDMHWGNDSVWFDSLLPALRESVNENRWRTIDDQVMVSVRVNMLGPFVNMLGPFVWAYGPNVGPYMHANSNSAPGNKYLVRQRFYYIIRRCVCRWPFRFAVTLYVAINASRMGCVHQAREYQLCRRHLRDELRWINVSVGGVTQTKSSASLAHGTEDPLDPNVH